MRSKPEKEEFTAQGASVADTPVRDLLSPDSLVCVIRDARANVVDDGIAKR